MTMKIKDLKVGQRIYNDISGATRYKVVKIDEAKSNVILWNEKTRRATSLNFDSLEKYWSIGVPKTRWGLSNW
jgi:hypothetical protein